MSYGDFTRIAVLATSIALVGGLYAQVLKIWHTRSARDFSLILIIALLLDGIAWLNYGFILREWPILTIGFISFPAVIGAFVGYLKYGRVKA